LAGFEDALGEDQAFAHGGAGDDFAVLALRFEALAKGPDRRIMTPRHPRGEVQGFAQARIAGFRQTGVAFPFSGRALFGREAGEGGDTARTIEALNVA